MRDSGSEQPVKAVAVTASKVMRKDAKSCPVPMKIGAV
jgi:hypothetical protein